MINASTPPVAYSVAQVDRSPCLSWPCLGWRSSRHVCAGADAQILANKVAVNGSSSFFRALRTTIEYTTYTQPGSRAPIFTPSENGWGRDGPFTRLGEGRVDRHFPANPKGLGKLNVVVVSSEPSGAEFSKLYGSERDLTPNFDAFAQQGMWFRHTYASGTRTVRGLEAYPRRSRRFRACRSCAGRATKASPTGARHAPARLPHELPVRRLRLLRQHERFLRRQRLRGRATADIAKGPLREHLGRADEDLFDHALGYFDQRAQTGKPFFSIIMTTSNHKPFTFPAGARGRGIPPEGGGREAGVRYADYALGYFLREAQEHAVVRQHAVRRRGRPRRAGLRARRTFRSRPTKSRCMFYAPKHLAPGRWMRSRPRSTSRPRCWACSASLPGAVLRRGRPAHAPAEHGSLFFSHNHDVAL